MISTYKLYLGIDVAKNSYQIAFLPLPVDILPAWSTVSSISISPCKDGFTRLTKAINDRAEPRDVAAGIDGTSSYYAAPVIQHLATLGCNIFAVSPEAGKSLREGLLQTKLKTDHIDAVAFAYGTYLYETIGWNSGVHRFDLELTNRLLPLVQFVRLRTQTVKLKTQATNRIRALLPALYPEASGGLYTRLIKALERWVDMPENSLADAIDGSSITRSRREELKLLLTETVGIRSEPLREGLRTWVHFRRDREQEIKSIDKRIAHFVNEHPYGFILKSFPNIGNVRAALLICAIKDISRWRSSASLKKALGYYGVVRSSGDSYRITRGPGGNKEAKSALFQTVVASLPKVKRNPSDFVDRYFYHKGKGATFKKAVYKAASSMVDIIYSCLKTRQAYSYQGRYRKYNPLYET
jgi:transposase